MPYKDKAVQNKASHEYGKKTYYAFPIRIRKDDPLYAALFRMRDFVGIPFSTYAQTALREKLSKEGYLKESKITE